MNRLMQIVITICFCLGMMTLDCFAESEIPIYPAWEITLSSARTGGTGGSLYVSNNNTEIATEEAYKTYLSYSLSGIDKSRVTSALIEAVCTQEAVGEKEKLQIYGVPEPIDMISPDTITWENAPCNIPSSAVALSEEALFLADLCIDKKNVPLTAVSQRLTEFVQEDTNGVITLIVVRQSLRNSRYSLASSENKNYPPPVLKLSGGLAIEGFDEGDTVFAVVNTFGKKRAGIVSADIDVRRVYGAEKLHDSAAEIAKSLYTGEYEIVSESGKILPCRVEKADLRFGYDLPRDRFRQPYMAETVSVLFETEDISAMGYAVYALRKTAAAAEKESLVREPNTMENEHIKVKINSDGTIDVLDKKTQKSFFRAFKD